MKFSNFLRRFNRGIALGILLLIGLTIYIMVSEKEFDKERELIKSTLTEFVEVSGDLMLLPEEYRVIGAKIPDSVITKKLEDNNAVIDQYFSYDVSRYGDVIAKNMKEEVKYALEHNKETGNVLESCTSKVVKVGKISKAGTGYAQLEITVRTTANMTQEAQYLAFAQTQYPNNYNGNRTDSEHLSLSTKSMEITCTIDVKKIDDVWKIAERYGYYSENSSTQVIYN